MASEPTLKDVVKLLGLLQTNVEGMRADAAAHRAETAALRADSAAHREETKALTATVGRGFARIDAKLVEIEDELEAHTKAHEEIDKQLAALKRAARPSPRPARARRSR